MIDDVKPARSRRNTEAPLGMRLPDSMKELRSHLRLGFNVRSLHRTREGSAMAALIQLSVWGSTESGQSIDRRSGRRTHLRNPTRLTGIESEGRHSAQCHPVLSV